jgi:high-affinity K+ transport system ATPase subunit B
MATPAAPRSKSVWDRQIVRRAIVDAFRKLHPRRMTRNPVMFVVEIGSVLTTWRLVQDAAAGTPGIGFELQITAWLWLTVLFANFAEAMAEGRGKAQADTLRRTRTETVANRLADDGRLEKVPAATLNKGDVVIVHAGEFIPGDGEIVEGVASVDESAITGESAPVIRESGGDRSAVTGGTRVLSDWIKMRISSDPGHTFLDRMIALVEGAERQKTPNEIALNILLAGLTIVFLIAVVTLQPFAVYSGAPQSLFVLVSLLVCLIPTTIGGLLSAIGIAGMDRLVQHNVLAMSGRSAEAAGDVHTLLLDKTGTITLGNRQATELVPLAGVAAAELADAAQLASLADETPEGRSIVVLALAQADVGVAMNTGTQAAKEAGNMVDLDSNPTKLIEIVEIGKQLLITRGALTTFSIANDVAKYFAIIPAMFLAAFPPLDALNVMGLQTPQSAILSAVIFNALVIVALVPLALGGIQYRPIGAAALLRRNLLIYGAGGIIAPFAGIKAIDVIITTLGLTGSSP